MPLARSTHRVARFAPLAVLVGGVIAVANSHSGASPVVQTSAAKATPTEVEVRCADDSTLKLKLLDDRLEVNTKYGRLEIPAAEIRRIEFATRIPSEVAERVALLISNLNHPDFDMREKAMTELRELRERSYAALVKAMKHADAEISRRAEESVRYLQQKVPAGQLEPRDNDVIYTDDCKITGKLATASLRVQTLMFGEQSLRLTDVRSLKSMTGNGDTAVAGIAPTNMMTYQNQIGKEVAFTVTGPTTGQGQSVWGTDLYTLDSSLGAAAVHAGFVQPGHSAVVRVRILASPQQFAGTTRNGISSAPYGIFPAGAFEFLRR
jgi:hypothetical protein